MLKKAFFLNFNQLFIFLLFACNQCTVYRTLYRAKFLPLRVEFLRDEITIGQRENQENLFFFALFFTRLFFSIVMPIQWASIVPDKHKIASP